MIEILLFGGTSEGRELAALLEAKGVETLVCVATDYGEALLGAGNRIHIHNGRLDETAMEALMRAQSPRKVIDATHPYAEVVSHNIRAACKSTNTEYVRLRRESALEDHCRLFASMAELIAWLNETEGVIFSTLGAKEVEALRGIAGFQERVWLRVLPSVDGLAACLKAGFPAKHIICMQGPFSEELNTAMFQAAGASIMITKESGSVGGFPQKLAAARACGMIAAVLSRPNEEGGIALAELRQKIEGGVL
ncbi:MAG: precorrin-6A reductase [Candidatus Pelethousia sp.]|nr:precorrin-6A reductase [Candidatus Pelethousia sp.]